MLQTMAWLITGKRGLRYVCLEEGAARNWIQRLTLEVDARLSDLVARWEADQEREDAVRREREQLPYGIEEATRE